MNRVALITEEYPCTYTIFPLISNYILSLLIFIHYYSPVNPTPFDISLDHHKRSLCFTLSDRRKLSWKNLLKYHKCEWKGL